jgi:hypothetical protein
VQAVLDHILRLSLRSFPSAAIALNARPSAADIVRFRQDLRNLNLQHDGRPPTRGDVAEAASDVYQVLRTVPGLQSGDRRRSHDHTPHEEALRRAYLFLVRYIAERWPSLHIPKSGMTFPTDVFAKHKHHASGKLAAALAAHMFDLSIPTVAVYAAETRARHDAWNRAHVPQTAERQQVNP